MLLFKRQVLRKAKQNSKFDIGLDTKESIDRKFNQYEREFKGKLVQYVQDQQNNSSREVMEESQLFERFVIKIDQSLKNLQSSREKLISFLENQLGLQINESELIKSQNKLSELRKIITASIRKLLNRSEDREEKRRQSKAENLIKYGWLQISSKYDALKEKLKKTIIQKLNEYENSKIIQYYYSKNTENFKYDASLEKFITSQGKIRLLIQNNNPSKIHLKNYSESKSVDVWDQLAQEQYQNNSVNVKQKYKKGLPSQKCSESYYLQTRSISQLALRTLSMQPLFHQVNDQSSIRPALLKKYESGQEMSKEQMQLLVNTSPLMNKCINKKYIMSTVQLIDKPVISQILKKISINVLEDWQKKKNEKIKKRLIYKRNASLQTKAKIMAWQQKEQQRKSNQISNSNKLALQNQLNQINLSVKKRPQSCQPKRQKVFLPIGQSQKHPPNPIFYIQPNQQQVSLYKIERDQINYLKMKKNKRSKANLATSTFYSGGPTSSQISSQTIQSDIRIIQKVMRSFLNRLNFKQKHPPKDKKIPNLKRPVLTEEQPKDITQPVFLKKQNSSQTANSQLSIVRKIVSLIKKEHLNQLMQLNLEPYFFDLHDKEGKTPLYCAALLGFHNIVSFLLTKGADPNKKCIKGNTPCHSAFMSNSQQVILLMMMNGGNFQLTNDQKLTPVAYGKRNMLERLGLQDSLVVKHEQ